MAFFCLLPRFVYNSAMNRKSVEMFLAEVLPNYQDCLMIAGDASFRKYYRVWQRGVSYIVMDAPPTHENAELFVQVATAFAQAGLCVPEIIDDDLTDGYLLLSDLGDATLQSHLTAFPEQWLPVCLDTLFKLQQQGGQHLLELPSYDTTLLLNELSLFSEWFVAELLTEKLSTAEEQSMNTLNQLLIDSALNQPRVWVHRDYHSRNLMKISETQIGLIDFQDAVFGAVTYDLVSLLKDCYVRYPKALITQCLKDYYIQLVSAEMFAQDFQQFERGFDLMGLQRHLKVLGIFSRLSLRDGKHVYLNDLPLVFDYVFETLTKYPELNHYLPLFERLGVRLEQKVLL